MLFAPAAPLSTETPPPVTCSSLSPPPAGVLLPRPRRLLQECRRSLVSLLGFRRRCRGGLMVAVGCLEGSGGRNLPCQGWCLSRSRKERGGIDGQFPSLPPHTCTIDHFTLLAPNFNSYKLSFRTCHINPLHLISYHFNGYQF